MLQNDETSVVFTDFQQFRSEIGRLCKKMAENPDLRAIFHVRRNLNAGVSSFRQLEYVLELTDNLVDIRNLASQGLASPFSPDFPESEPKPDETLEKE